MTIDGRSTFREKGLLLKVSRPTFRSGYSLVSGILAPEYPSRIVSLIDYESFWIVVRRQLYFLRPQPRRQGTQSFPREQRYLLGKP
jgi:hypothetical protein